MGEPWTCIVITCSNVNWSCALEKSLRLLRDQCSDNTISSNTAILSAVDPDSNIGSGAATLNALFVAAEYLAAKNNFSAVTSDVLQNANILILHHGRDYAFDVSGKALISIPYNNTINQDSGLEIRTNLEHLFSIVSTLQNNAQSGVWVCSTDTSFVQHSSVLDIMKAESCHYNDCTIFTVNSTEEYASNHGVVISEDDGYVKSIVYCASKEYLKDVAKDNKVQVISGIVYFPFKIAESLLTFYNIAPLNSCTYVGIDSGSEPLKMSLFFDILVTMIKNISLEDYSTGIYGNLYNLKSGLDQQRENVVLCARKIIWSCLSKYNLKVVNLENLSHCYWDERLPALNHVTNMLSFGKTGLNQSVVKAATYSSKPNSILVNSILVGKEVSIGSNSVICNSTIHCGNINIGNNCLISGVEVDIPNTETFSVLNNLVVLGFGNKSKEGGRKIIIFDINSSLHSIDVDMFCDIPIKKWLEITGLSVGDIWLDKPHTLWHAKIFPEKSDISFYAKLYSGNYDALIQTNWKETQRFSISDLTQNVDALMELDWRQTIKSRVICNQIESSIISNTDQSFLHFFKVACSEGWHLNVLKTLDCTAEKLENKNFELCRTLSCIADMLGSMAGIMGRLRSGPGNNKAWIMAFDYLRRDDPGKAILALKKMREEWLSSNLIIRAARHYESALQIFIQSAVKSAKVFINLKSCTLPDMGIWVTAMCPARVDLQGGWSDTPPICYEQGGSVVNVAVLIDDKKPVGAKIRKTKHLSIRFIINNLDFEQELEINSLTDLADYNQPSANGALLKAAVICAELVDLYSRVNLQEQLSKYGGGFELHVWSCLPQGSGLGTSSILAGCVIAVLWTVSGRAYTKNCLLHAVLYLEQLLTTGGGWQDQVGGIMGGVNRGYSMAALPLEVKVKSITIREHFLYVLNTRLFLIYTGKVRLAKNLLQNVIRNWYARERNVVDCFKDLVTNSYAVQESFENEDLIGIGAQMNKYWEQKKILAPGCDPIAVQKLMLHLESHTLGQLLVGAGGGGFMCILTKLSSSVQEIQELIAQLPFAESMSVHSAHVDMEGIVVKISERRLNLL